MVLRDGFNQVKGEVNMVTVSVDCIDTLDPKVVRVSFYDANGNTIYAIDIPASIYPEIGATFGWPTNPCTVE